MNESTTHTEWGIVELLGHRICAGEYRWDDQGGVAMLQVNVPKTSTFDAYTQFYGRAAIYCLTPVSEEIALRAAEHYKVNPISVYVPNLVTEEQAQKLKDEIERLGQQWRLTGGFGVGRLSTDAIEDILDEYDPDGD